MEKIQFDSGVKQYKINGNGVLQFNPADPNVYERFLAAAEKIKALEAQLRAKADTAHDEGGTQVVHLMAEADKQMKDILSWVFGEGNDMNAILGGVNLLAMASNGERVVTNLFAALQPILVEGAQSCAKQTTQAAVEKAKQRRAAQ